MVKQAPMTVDTYLREAVERIDGVFGDGYAKSHPELVAAFIAACVEDFSTAATVKLAEEDYE